MIAACGLQDQKVLFVKADSAPVLVQSSRNLPKVKMTHLGSLATYDVLAADVVLFTRSALERLVENRGQRG